MQWPTGTGAKGNAGVAGAVTADGRAPSATSSRPTRCRTASRTPSVKNKAGQVRRADARLDQRRRATGVTVPANLGIKIVNSPARAPTRSPRRRSSSSTRTCARRAPRRRSRRQGRRASSSSYGLGAGQSVLVAGRLRRAAGRDPGQVQGGRDDAGVQRLADRRLTEETNAPRPGYN